MNKGYTVVDGFLQEDEADLMLQHYRQARLAHASNEHDHQSSTRSFYDAIPLSDMIKNFPNTLKRIHSTVLSVQGMTDIQIYSDSDPLKKHEDSAVEVFLMTTDSADGNASLNFIWHTDFGGHNWYSKKDYLIFYIILDKPDPEAAGLEVVPLDTLRARSPRLYELVHQDIGALFVNLSHPGVLDCLKPRSSSLGKAKTFVSKRQFDHGYFLDFDFDRDDLKCSPRLIKGDLLLLRQDIIHQTQALKQSRRTAMVVRVGKLNEGCRYMGINPANGKADIDCSAGFSKGTFPGPGNLYKFAWLRHNEDPAWGLIEIQMRYLGYFRHFIGWLMGETILTPPPACFGKM